ncbi:hypothetical protein KCP73_15935 [Salmonella enterica subsp. enterica]|nr:hypothetical protein KCP73_15935 [Salmonella enterica subsp. enterica]
MMFFAFESCLFALTAERRMRSAEHSGTFLRPAISPASLSGRLLLAWCWVWRVYRRA